MRDKDAQWRVKYLVFMKRGTKVHRTTTQNVRRKLPIPFIFLALLVITHCGRSTRPPAPPDTGPPPVSRPDEPPEPDRAMPPPALKVSVEPESIARGDSALLSWEAEHADHVTISQNVGIVETSGRIRFFPDETTTYAVSAKGPGGTTTRDVTIRVTDAPVRLGEEDLELPLEERFERFVRPVFFEYDSAELSEEAKLTLDSNIGWLLRPENADLPFTIEGHCDERGTEEYNLALGDKRAQTVRAYLVENGVKASRITTVSLGEESPFDTGRTEEAWALNRRAHFVLNQ